MRFGEPVGETSATFALDRDSELRMARIDGRVNVRVRCVSGLLWITQHGDFRDYVLEPGEARTFRGPGSVVIHPIEPSICLIANEHDRPWRTRIEGHTIVTRDDGVLRYLPGRRRIRRRF